MAIKPLTYLAELKDKNTFLRDILLVKFQLSHSMLVKLKQQHKIKVNGNPARTNYQVQVGDQITIELDLDLREDNQIIPEALPLEVIYEDADFLVINKPAGMPIHPAKRNAGGTLANAVTYYWQQSDRPNRFRPINRLDKDTSGLVLVGNSQYAHQSMVKQLNQRRLERCYLALVEGEVKPAYGRIDQPIARAGDAGRKRMADPNGQKAITDYWVLRTYPGRTLLGLKLATGRTHQIRVHLKYLGHPICGDELYGDKSSLINRQALHAAKLSFVHPRTGKEVTLTAPLPEDIKAALHRLANQ